MRQTVLYSLMLLMVSSPVLAAVTIGVPEQVSGGPGATVLVPITIDNAAGVAGASMILAFDSHVVSASEVRQASLIGDFHFVSHIVDNEVRLAFAHATGLPAGSGPLANISLIVNAQAIEESNSALTLSGVVVYDENAQRIETAVSNGRLVVDTTFPLSEFSLTVSQGINLIHLPLAVTVVDNKPMEIQTVGDLYDALGSDRVNFIIGRDVSVGAWWSYLGEQSRGTPADARITADMGIIALMNTPVTLHLKGYALGTDGMSAITLQPGTNLVGIPLRYERLEHVSDLLGLEGIRGSATAIIVSDNGQFKVVAQPGDDGDIPITGGRSFIITARAAGTAKITGTPWGDVTE